MVGCGSQVAPEVRVDEGSTDAERGEGGDDDESTGSGSRPSTADRPALLAPRRFSAPNGGVGLAVGETMAL